MTVDMKKNEMKRMTVSHSKFALLLMLAATFIASTAGAQIICNKFTLVTKVTSSTLDLSVDTDLPDNTVVMVSMYRSFGSLERAAEVGPLRVVERVHHYFSEKSIIGKWRSKHRISIASEKWKSTLRSDQERMSRIGLGFDVTYVSDKITVTMTVPIRQPDPRFGIDNTKLTGKAVRTRTSGYRVVVDKIEINYPLDSPPVGKSPFPSVFSLNLEIGIAYVVSEQTPLMPSHSPADPIAALKQMKQIPSGGVFKVLETVRKKDAWSPWYRVVAFDQRNKRIGTGWINSKALFGQRLKVYK